MTTKRYLIISICTIAIFNACTNKNLSIISEGKLFKRGMEYTKLSSIVYKNNTKAIVNATYLNPTYSNKYDNGYENFLIGVYITSNNSKLKDLSNKQYTLSLNDNINYTKKLISKDDKLLQNIPIENPYALYYIVSFKDVKSEKLTLSYKHKVFGTSSSNFKNF